MAKILRQGGSSSSRHACIKAGKRSNFYLVCQPFQNAAKPGKLRPGIVYRDAKLMVERLRHAFSSMHLPAPPLPMVLGGLNIFGIGRVETVRYVPHDVLSDALALAGAPRGVVTCWVHGIALSCYLICTVLYSRTLFVVFWFWCLMVDAWCFVFIYKFFAFLNFVAPSYGWGQCPDELSYGSCRPRWFIDTSRYGSTHRHITQESIHSGSVLTSIVLDTWV